MQSFIVWRGRVLKTYKNSLHFTVSYLIKTNAPIPKLYYDKNINTNIWKMSCGFCLKVLKNNKNPSLYLTPHTVVFHSCYQKREYRQYLTKSKYLPGKIPLSKKICLSHTHPTLSKKRSIIIIIIIITFLFYKIEEKARFFI